jgi:hypothetical protein
MRETGESLGMSIMAFDRLLAEAQRRLALSGWLGQMGYA